MSLQVWEGRPMSEIKTRVRVDIDRFDGKADGDIGHSYFVAHSPELHFTTEANTFEELLNNVRECLQLCLEDGDGIGELRRRTRFGN